MAASPCGLSRWRDYTSTLAWECLGIPQSELVEVAREKEVWGSLLTLLIQSDPTWDKQATMDGVDGIINIFHIYIQIPILI